MSLPKFILNGPYCCEKLAVFKNKFVMLKIKCKKNVLNIRKADITVGCKGNSIFKTLTLQSRDILLLMEVVNVLVFTKAGPCSPSNCLILVLRLFFGKKGSDDALWHFQCS